MERAAERNDDALLRRTSLGRRPTTHQLDRRLVRLGAGIAQEHALGEMRCVHQLFGQPQRRLGVEHVAAVPELVRLRGERRQQICILMAKRVHRDAGTEVDVIVALGIPDSRALAVIEHQFARLVHRYPVTLAEVDQGLRGVIFCLHDGFRASSPGQHRLGDGWERGRPQTSWRPALPRIINCSWLLHDARGWWKHARSGPTR